MSSTIGGSIVATVNGASGNRSSTTRSKIGARRESIESDSGVGVESPTVAQVPAWKRELLLKRRTYNWMAKLLSTTTTTAAAAATTIASSSSPQSDCPSININKPQETIDLTNNCHSSELECSIHAQLNNSGHGDGDCNGDTVQLTNGIHEADLEPTYDDVDDLNIPSDLTCNIPRVGLQKSTMASDVSYISEQSDVDCYSLTHSESTALEDIDLDDNEIVQDDDNCSSIHGLGEMEYGPGIVNRLRSKFINMTLNSNGHFNNNNNGSMGSNVRRVASMEHLLDDREVDHVSKFVKNSTKINVPRFYPSRSPRRDRSSSVSPISTCDVIKRARSMETLSGPSIFNTNNNNNYNNGGSIFRLRPFMTRSYSTNADDLLLTSSMIPLTSLALINENVIIIEQTKPQTAKDETIGKGPSLSTLRVAKDSGNVALKAEDEFPKPDTVRTFKRIFEPNGVGTKTVTSGPLQEAPKIKRKVTPPPKPIGLKPLTKPKPILNGCGSLDGGAKYGPRPSRIPTKLIASNPNPNESAKPVEVTHQEVESIKSKEETPCSSVCNINDVVVVVETPADIKSAKKVIPEDLDYVIHNLKHVSSSKPVNGTPEMGLTRDKPKVVSIQPKLEEKPIGHIRPFQNAEQFKNKTDEVESEETPLVNCRQFEENHSTVSTVNQPQPSPPPSTGPVIVKKSSNRSMTVTQTFNFIGKDVQPHIANTTAPFAVKRPSQRNVTTDKVDGNCSRNKENFDDRRSGNYIIAGTDVDASWRNHVDEEDEDEDDGMPVNNYNAYLAMVFIGANVIVGRSALLKNRNKKLKIAFDDTALTTYEYPSESSLMENGHHQEQEDGDDDHKPNGDNPQSLDSSSCLNNGGDEKGQFIENVLTSSSRPETLKSTPAIGSTGGLASYTPMAVVGSGTTFELGVLPRQPPQNPKTTISKEATEEEIFLKPASDEQNSAWSNTETVDLLF